MENEIKKGILVPTDFSEACDNALDHALKLAKIFNYTVYVLHVIDDDAISHMKKYDINIEHVRTRLRDYIAGKNYLYIKSVLDKGDIFSKINEVAINKGCQMIVLGTHGKVGFQKITGSYALKVIDSTELPVICVQDIDLTSGYKTIVFPIRLGNEDRQKAEFAVMLAKAFGSVIHIFPHYESDNAIKNKIMPRIKQLKSYFKKYDVEHIDVLSDKYGTKYHEQIINYSNEVTADLILIMADSDKHGSLFGSWEEYIIFNPFQIPVMCVNTKKLRQLTFMHQTGAWA